MLNSNIELEELLTTIRALRGENGCPWDSRQTSVSLIKYLKSECDELVEAIQTRDIVNICEECGDMLYLIVMISEINADQNNFNLNDVISSINAKLIRRHPHVFAGVPVGSEQQLKEQWQEIKASEKSKKSV